MSSSFFGLQIGRSSLLSHQLAIDTTGHNLSNVNTEGYSRQKVSVSQTSLSDMPYGPQGVGVTVDEVYRVHETFLERQISRVQAQNSYDVATLQGLEELQAVLDEPSATGINAALSSFWNSWEALSIRPTDGGLRHDVLEKAQLLANEYNIRVQGLLGAENGFNDEIESRVNLINEMAAELGDLNGKVASAEASGTPANDLRDQRDRIVRSISELLGVEPEFDDGNLNLRLAESGAYIVSGTNVHEFHVQKDIEGWVTGINLEIHPVDVDTGQLGAFLNLRDNVSTELRDELATLMARVTDRVNQLQNEGYDGELRQGLNMFNWEGEAQRVQVYPSSGLFDVAIGAGLEAGTHHLTVTSVDQAGGAPLVAYPFGTLTTGQINLTHTGGLYTGENQINHDYNVRVLQANTNAGDLGGMRVQLYSGDEAVGQIHNLVTGVDPQTLNWTVDGMDISAQITLGADNFFNSGQRSDGLTTTGMVSLDGGVAIAVDPAAATSYNFVTGNDNRFTVGGGASVTFDVFHSFSGTAFTINSSDGLLRVNPGVAGDSSRVAVAVPRELGGAPTPGDGEMARRIASLAHEQMFEFSGDTASARLGGIVQELGERGRQGEIYESASKTILMQLDGQKQSISGVNLDEEMVHLIQFQRGFEAAARFVTTNDQMLDVIINRLGRVGL